MKLHTTKEQEAFGRMLQQQIGAAYGDNAINTACYYLMNLDVQNAARGLGVNHSIFMLNVMVAWIGLNTDEGQTADGFDRFIDGEAQVMKSMYPDLKIMWDKAKADRADELLRVATPAGRA